MPTQSVCLNMIVRDEAHVLRRCLRSLRSHIDYWVIVDTGSVDDTANTIKQSLGAVPGELHGRPWRDFGSNRNEALSLARTKSDYILFMDADEELCSRSGRLQIGGADYYEVLHESGCGLWYDKLKIVHASPRWRWVGVIHEYLACDSPARGAPLPDVWIRGHLDSARNQDSVAKHARDAKVLESMLVEDPCNLRCVFQYAQTLRSSGQLVKAERAYERRIALGGNGDELWYSIYQLALVRLRLDRDWETIQRMLELAHAMRPERAEPLWTLAVCFRWAGRYRDAFEWAARAMALPVPRGLFVQRSVYQWEAAAEYVFAACKLELYREALPIAESLLEDLRIPDSGRRMLQRNRDYCTRMLGNGTAIALVTVG